MPFRRFLRTLLALLSLALPANAGSVVDLSTQLTTTGQDAWPFIQGAVDAAVGPTEVRLPAGAFVLSRPVIVDKDAIRVRGAGRDLTTFQVWAGQGFVFGLRRNVLSSGIPSDDHFPPTDGHLGGTAAGRVGLRTCGDTVFQFPNHPWAWGGPAAADPTRAWDHWADLPGFTLSIAFDPNGQTSFNLVAIGNSWMDPEPYWAGVVPGSQPGMLDLAILYRLAGDVLIQGAPYRRADLTIPGVGISRVDLSWDFKAGALTARLGGQPAPLTGQTAWAAGTGFPRTRGQYPFTVAHEGMMPPMAPPADWALWGLKTYATAAPPDLAAGDSRYFDATAPGCIAAWSGVKDPTGRLLPTADGPAAVVPGPRAGWAFTTSDVGGPWLRGNAISDMTLTGGSPAVALGACGDFRGERLALLGNSAGIASVPCGVSYPMTLRDLTTGGTGAGVSLFQSLAVLDRVDVQSGGRSFARAVGCSLDWRGGFFSYANGASETAIDCVGYPYGGSYTFASITVDNEGQPLSDSVVRCESTPYFSGALNLRSLGCAGLGPGASFVHLIGAAPGPITKPAALTAFDLAVTGGGAFAAGVRVDGGTNWSGSADLTQINPAVVGPGAASIVTRGATR